MEGVIYVTALLVPIPVFQVRKAFLKVTNNQETVAPVRDLTRILLADFDKCYVPPADESGTKLSFKWGASVGARNGYNTIHHFFFVAAFLDTRVKKMLKKLFMTANDYQLLRREIQKLMEAEAMKQMGRNNEEHQTETPIQTEQNKTSTSKTITSASAKSAIMFDGLIDMEEDEEDDDDEGGENNIEKNLCDMANEELDRFDKIQIVPLVNRDGSYVNPLPWWRDNASRFPRHDVPHGKLTGAPQALSRYCPQILQQGPSPLDFRGVTIPPYNQ